MWLFAENPFNHDKWNATVSHRGDKTSVFSPILCHNMAKRQQQQQSVAYSTVRQSADVVVVVLALLAVATANVSYWPDKEGEENLENQYYASCESWEKKDRSKKNNTDQGFSLLECVRLLFSSGNRYHVWFDPLEFFFGNCKTTIQEVIIYKIYRIDEKISCWLPV